MDVSMYVLSCLSVVTMGYHVPLDVCFGDQHAGSAHEPMHRGWNMFLSRLSYRNLGHSLKFFVLV